MNYFYEKELKQSPLPVGFIVVCAPQGGGKTSLCTAWLATDYKYHNKDRNKRAQAHIDFLNKNCGYKNLTLPEHLYFSNIEIALNAPLGSKKAVYTHYINTQNLGLPNPDYEAQYFPKGSVVFISEADMLLYCHDYQKISKYIWNLIKYVRHNEMTVIFDMQVFSRLGKQLRLLATDLIYIDYSYYKKSRFFGLIKDCSVWNFHWRRPQEIENRKDCCNVSKKDLGEKGSFKYKGCVFNQYNSFSGEMYFLKDIENVGYKTKQHPRTDYTPSGVSQYCKMLPLVTPPKNENSSD